MTKRRINGLYLNEHSTSVFNECERTKSKPSQVIRRRLTKLNSKTAYLILKDGKPCSTTLTKPDDHVAFIEVPFLP